MHDDKYLTLIQVIGVLPGNTAKALFLYDSDVIAICSLSHNIFNMSRVIIILFLSINLHPYPKTVSS